MNPTVFTRRGMCTISPLCRAGPSSGEFLQTQSLRSSWCPPFLLLIPLAESDQSHAMLQPSTVVPHKPSSEEIGEGCRYLGQLFVS
jgi:hypothetical protein